MSTNVEQAMNKNYSFWQYKYGDYQANPALRAGDYETDVLIIGAGYTGLTTAREVRKDDPNKRVMVLDANEIGFGASGRNGGFNMTLFGVEPEITVMRWGKDKAKEAQTYMQNAVAYVKEVIESEGLDSDYEHTGMLRVAYTERQEKRLKKTYRLLNEISKPGSFQYWNAEDVKDKLNAPNVRGAIYEPETGILDPCKHVRALKGLAEKQGAEIYENTAVTHLSRGKNGVTVKTKIATIVAKKVVVATNAWTHNVPGSFSLSIKQSPVWTYQVVTEPLSQREWENIKWDGRMSIEDNRQFVHYMRITKCGRVTMGGGNIGVGYNAKDMTKWADESIWKDLENHLKWLFPTLRHKKIHYKWGGCVSANMDMTPEIGFLGGPDIIYSAGCIGHGVSLTQLNGRVIADLILGKKTERSFFWIVNRNAIPLPPGNLLRYIGVKTIEGVLKTVDRYEEAGLKSG